MNSMRWWLLGCVCLLLSGAVLAQDNPTPYEIALAKIQEAQATGATELDLSDLGLEVLPPEIGELRQLRELQVDRNQLQSLPPEIGNLANLQSLSLYNNKLAHLPAEIGNLGNLQWLNLSFNQLSTLPPEIGKLTNLHGFSFNYNHLSSLPAEIGNLTNLHFLWLNHNQLSSLPPEIGDLTNLCILDLAYNHFQQLPIFLGQIDRLRFPPHSDCEGIFLLGLLVNDNPLISPPPEVVAQGTNAILDYLNDEAAWHLRRLIAGGAAGTGMLALVILGLRWRYAVARGAGQKREKKKRAA